MNRTLKNILLTPMNVLYRINPKLELKLMFYLKHGYKLNLNDPKTYNEKLNWMKLYYRNELMPICADKYTVRQYVKDCGCGEILNELYWEGFDAEDIPFDDLPKQFVIKVTHGSGNNIICTDKDKLNKKKTIRRLNRWLKQKYLPCYGEWFYGKVKPRIIIEKFLTEDGRTSPEDYKLYCFNNINGKHDVGITAVHKGRFSRQRTKTIYDSQWNLKSEVIFGDPPDLVDVVEKPKKYREMVEYAKLLSKPFPHARVDFYIIKDKVYFGEITFTTGAGFNKIRPRSFDETMGSWIELPSTSKAL